MSIQPKSKLPPMLLGSLGALGVLIGFGLAVTRFSEPEIDPALLQGIQVVRHLSSPNALRTSSFLAMNPKGRPSEFVEWMFSIFGTAEWPPREGSSEVDALGLNGTGFAGMPLLPQDVTLTPFTLNPEAGKQVVIKPDNARSLLIAEAYETGSGAPVAIQEWPLKIPEIRSRPRRE